MSTIGLWITTRKGLRDQARDMKRSIAAAEIAAHSANSSSRVAASALVDIERAFVFAESPIIISPINIEDRNSGFFIIQTTLVNNGNTATSQARIHSSVGVFDHPLPENFDYPDLGDETPGKVFIGPKGRVNTQAHKIPRDLIRAVLKKDKFLYTWT